MSRFVRRSWGWYITLLDRRHFKVKLLRFHAGKKCSRQFHYLRNELWLFLTGIHAGCWTNFSRQEVHSYGSRFPSLVLEIQYGEKCIEEDIVRT